MTRRPAGRARDRRDGPDDNFGATYYDARNEAIRRGDRTAARRASASPDPGRPGREQGQLGG